LADQRGLQQWRHQPQDINARVIQTLLATGRVKHLAPALVESAAPDDARQAPPTLPGPAVSEILVAQRRGGAVTAPAEGLLTDNPNLHA